MSVTEEIVKEAVGLDFTQQREILMFVKFLKTARRELKGDGRVTEELLNILRGVDKVLIHHQN